MYIKSQDERSLTNTDLIIGFTIEHNTASNKWVIKAYSQIGKIFLGSYQNKKTAEVVFARLSLAVTGTNGRIFWLTPDVEGFDEEK